MKKRNLKRQEEERLERKAKTRAFLTLLFVLCLTPSFAKYHFTFSPNCVQAQQKTYELQLSDALNYLSKEAASDPENLAVEYLKNFNLTLKAFVTESDEDYKALKTHFSKAYEKLEGLEDSDPYKRFALAEMDFQLAMVKGKHEDYYSAALNTNSAYKHLKSNLEKHPEFILSKKTLGLMNAYLSTVPDSYNWAIKLLGMKGSLSKGLAMLKEVAYTADSSAGMALLSKEAHYLYSFTLYHISKDNAKGWSEMKKCTKDFSSNGLSNFFRALMASRLHKNDEVISTIRAYPKASSYQHIYFNDYLLGLSLLNELNKDAVTHLNNYYTKFKGKNYIKSCLQKMSWYYTIFGNDSKARYYKDLIPKYGQAAIEEDELAVLFVNKPKPHKLLLRSRLLFDGGHYDKALEEIKDLRSADLSTNDEKAEYAYRKGRIFSKKGNDHVASLFYIACAKFAVKSQEYYGAYACLYLGDHYKAIGDKEKAKEYYRKALNFKENKEYKGSIEQRAKLELKRL